MAKRRLPSKEAAARRLGASPDEARKYVARWKRVNAHIAAERRAMTPTERFRDLVDLMDWVDLFGSRKALETDEEQAREVWNRLRRSYRAKA
jgi:hypothetical protein